MPLSRIGTSLNFSEWKRNTIEIKKDFLYCLHKAYKTLEKNSAAFLGKF